MEFKTPKNINYTATVVEIKNIIPMFTAKGEPCNTIQATTIFGNNVVIGKDTKVGDVGLFFPVETQLSKEFLFENSLYRKLEINKDITHKGLFEENGRVKCQKLQGNPSMGFFCPIDYLTFAMGKAHRELLNIGDSFDFWADFEICRKYIPKNQRTPGQGNANGKGKVKRVSRLVDNQFRLHYDTSQLGKNIHLFNPDTIVSITRKLHGTSLVVSKVLVKKKLSVWQRILQKLGANVITTEFGNIYSSRKVVQNQFEEGEKEFNSFYGGTIKENIYKTSNDELKEFLVDGMTIYAEVVGYLSTGASIQKPFDYGCAENQHAIYIYRITYTNAIGNVFEFSAKQVQNWCNLRGLKPVPELYYGTFRNLFPEISTEQHWHENVLIKLREKYLEFDEPMCRNKVPTEGVVVRLEDTGEAFKFKSFTFLKAETDNLDKGVEDMEEQTGDEV